MGHYTTGGKITGINGYMSALALLLVVISCIILFTPVSAQEIDINESPVDGQTITKDIAGAIATAKPGSVLIIESGTWEGNFEIDKPITLLGVDTGTGMPHVITKEGLAGIRISSDNVSIEGLTISGNSDCAIWIEGNRTKIARNTILETPIAISVISGSDNLLSGNSVINHSVGVYANKGVSGFVTLNNFDNRVNAKSVTTDLNWSSVRSSYLYGNEIYESQLGNYWDDYKGTDQDGDGVGNIAYMPYTSASDIRDAIGPNFIESLSEEGVEEAYEGYWTGLFRDANYVRDKYPLNSENSMYVVVPETAQADIITAGDQNRTTVAGDASYISDSENSRGNTGVSEDVINASVPLIQGSDAEDPFGSEPFLYIQHPFEIVFVMILIAGVFSGLIAILGRFGRMYGLKGSRWHETIFLGLAFGSMAITLLYAVTSYTSRLIYRLIDYGVIQVIFIFITAYIIASSGFLAFGLLRRSLPIYIYRLHAPVAVSAIALFAFSLYTAPVELGPVTGLAYPAALLLSIALPLAFRHRFRAMLIRWDAENDDLKATSFDPDSTSLFMAEEDIMSSSLSSSYFPESLHDKYSDVEFIGKGGIARVFRGKRRKDGVVVAVKVPINFDETTGRLFLKEMRIWEGLEHPNIAKLNSVNIFPVPYVEMEYLETPLSAVEKPLSSGRTLKIISDVSEGLAYAHSMGIIHRDIKPQNIMISSDDIAKITDWGLGKIMSDGNETTIVGFSLNYAAPEQVAPRTFGYPDERTDIYQLGVVFYELITGKKVFLNGGVAEVTDDILHRKPIPPSESGAESDIFDGIVMKCLNKSLDDRFNSVEEFKEALYEIAYNNESLRVFLRGIEPSG